MKLDELRRILREAEPEPTPSESPPDPKRFGVTYQGAFSSPTWDADEFKIDWGVPRDESTAMFKRSELEAAIERSTAGKLDRIRDVAKGFEKGSLIIMDDAFREFRPEAEDRVKEKVERWYDALIHSKKAKVE